MNVPLTVSSYIMAHAELFNDDPIKFDLRNYALFGGEVVDLPKEYADRYMLVLSPLARDNRHACRLMHELDEHCSEVGHSAYDLTMETLQFIER